MLGHGIGRAKLRPSATRRGSRASQGWQSFASLNLALPVSGPANYNQYLYCNASNSPRALCRVSSNSD